MWKWEAEGQAKAVVAIVHGAYEHHHRYAWFIQRLRNAGFHVVAGDLPGHGKERKNIPYDESFQSYIAYVKKLIDIGLNEQLPLFLYGHGLGATFLIHLLQQQPIECAGVTLSSPWLQLKHQPSKLSTILTKLSSSMKVDHEITVDMLTRNPEVYKDFHQDRAFTPMITAGWYRELQAFMRQVHHMEKMLQDVPVQLHLGGRDIISDREEAQKWFGQLLLSEYQCKVWRNAYHDVFQEPEREDIFFYTEDFFNNCLRSLGYIIS